MWKWRLAGQSGGNVSFTNCSNYGTIEGRENGGLCGSSAGISGGNVSFTNCSNNGTIEGREMEVYVEVQQVNSGGNVSFTNCSNYGENKNPESNGQILGSGAAIVNDFCCLIQIKGNNNQNITEYQAVELNLQ